MATQALRWLTPDWPAPATVRACFTLRGGGNSRPPFDSLNLAAHVGDRASDWRNNRQQLKAALRLANEPCWLNQSHGNQVYQVTGCEPCAVGVNADAAITRQAGLACTVLVADCVPVLVCDKDGQEVGAIHAGWRGLANGVIPNTLAAMSSAPPQLIAWIGPCIGASAYTVGAEVMEHFSADRQAQQRCFTAVPEGWQFDLAAMAAHQLKAAGLRSVTLSGECVYRSRERYFSFRRDGETGRMAALVWLDPASAAHSSR